MRGGETEVFDGKSLSGLLEDIYNISREKRRDIKSLIGELSKKIVSVGDAINIAPIIQQFLEVSVKNDEQLTKIATIVQRIISADAYQRGGDPAELLTEDEKEQLIKNATIELKEAAEELQDEIDIVRSSSGEQKNVQRTS